ncbi:MAG: hypothetical protein HZC36_05175 [Armatimonadetes bacterium]|nr:hypothetical protein [Armatimonadota bacterium]
MALSKRYYTLNGQLVGERATGGVRTDYMVDALGSVVGTSNKDNTVNRRYQYKPYGTRLSASGTGSDPRFQWVGAPGYRITDRSHSSHYVRARHYAQEEGRWTTVDPLWPINIQYGYVENRPLNFLDPSGLLPQISPSCASGLPSDHSAKLKKCVQSLCDALHDPKKMHDIRQCAIRNGIPARDLFGCLTRFCSGSGRVVCEQCDRSIPWQCTYVEGYYRCRHQCATKTIFVPPCGKTRCEGEFVASSTIVICTYWFNGSYRSQCNCEDPPSLPCAGNPNSTLIHEFFHVCGRCDSGEHDKAFDRAAKCVMGVLGCK